jgi:predicted ATPase with chaperone activity
MLAMARICAITGLDGAFVEVEEDIANGLLAFMIVGFPDATVNEAKEHVRAAIKNSGCLFLYKHIMVNLAPADLCKEGPAYDLPITVGLLILLLGQCQTERLITRLKLLKRQGRRAGFPTLHKQVLYHVLEQNSSKAV